MLDNLPFIYGLIALSLAVSALSYVLSTKKLISQAKQVQHLLARLQETSVQQEHLQRQVAELKSELSQYILDEQNRSMQATDLDQKLKCFQKQFSDQYEQELRGVNEQIERLSNQAPQDQLYSRAVKLATMGATRNEIVDECGILATEADMLLAIHKKS